MLTVFVSHGSDVPICWFIHLGYQNIKAVRSHLEVRILPNISYPIYILVLFSLLGWGELYTTSYIAHHHHDLFNSHFPPTTTHQSCYTVVQCRDRHGLDLMVH